MSCLATYFCNRRALRVWPQDARARRHEIIYVANDLSTWAGKINCRRTALSRRHYKSRRTISSRLKMSSERVITRAYKSPCGDLVLGSYGDKLCLCDWMTGSSCRNSVRQRLTRGLKTDFSDGTSDIIEKAATQFDEYFNGKRREFDIPLLFVGSDFQRKSLVWINANSFRTDCFIQIHCRKINYAAIRTSRSQCNRSKCVINFCALPQSDRVQWLAYGLRRRCWGKAISTRYRTQLIETHYYRMIADFNRHRLFWLQFNFFYRSQTSSRIIDRHFLDGRRQSDVDFFFSRHHFSPYDKPQRSIGFDKQQVVHYIG